MALNGDFSDFSLEEIVRLVCSTSRTGALDVSTPGQDGRIYVAKGSVSAISAVDEAFSESLRVVNRLNDTQLEAAIGGGASLAVLLGETARELVLEDIIEGLYRLIRPGEGSFSFVSDELPDIQPGYDFDLDRIFADVDRRAAEWSEIEQVVRDLEEPLRVVEVLSGDEVTISSAMWSVVVAFEGPSSVRDLAGRMGRSVFVMARECARLIRKGLVEYEDPSLRASAPPDVDTAWWTEPQSEDSSDDFLEEVFNHLDEGTGQHARSFGRRGIGAVARDLLDSRS